MKFTELQKRIASQAIGLGIARRKADCIIKILFRLVPFLQENVSAGAVGKELAIRGPELHGVRERDDRCIRYTRHQPGIAGLDKIDAAFLKRASIRSIGQFLKARRAFSLLPQRDQRQRRALTCGRAVACSQPGQPILIRTLRIPIDLLKALPQPLAVRLGERHGSNSKKQRRNKQETHAVRSVETPRLVSRIGRGHKPLLHQYGKNMLPTQLFAFGFGYVAGELAQALATDGLPAAGTTRTEASAAPLRAQGWDVTIWPDGNANPLKDAAWLISVPPDENGCSVFRAFSEQAQKARWIGYLSTTGVYGDLGGGWAFEETPINPQSREAANRAKAEEQWLSLNARVFRLPGIYGPGRSQLERVREPNARRIVKAGQVFSRAHVADIASALRLSIFSRTSEYIFNICDDEPAPADEVLAYAAKLLGLPAPPAVAFEDANLSPAALRFYAECKRVSNAKAKAVLGWRPQFPTYREGLADCLQRAAST